MNAGFRRRYLAVVLEAPDEIIEKRFEAVSELAESLDVHDAVGVVSIGIGLGQDPKYLAKARKIVQAHDEEFPVEGRDRELAFLISEVLRTVISLTPRRATDATALGTVTASWKQTHDADTVQLISECAAYVRERQRQLRASPVHISADKPTHSFASDLEASGLTANPNPIGYPQLNPLFESIGAQLNELQNGQSRMQADWASNLRVLTERSGIVAACLSRYSEICEAPYRSLGHAAIIAAAFDLASVTEFDLGPNAAKEYLKIMSELGDERLVPSSAVELLPSALASSLAERVVNVVTPILSGLRAAVAGESEDSLEFGLQLYNELLVSRLVKSG